MRTAGGKNFTSVARDYYRFTTCYDLVLGFICMVFVNELVITLIFCIFLKKKYFTVMEIKFTICIDTVHSRPWNVMNEHFVFHNLIFFSFFIIEFTDIMICDKNIK